MTLPDKKYCPYCGEPLDRANYYGDGDLDCDHCEEAVTPVTDSSETEMGDARHRIVCTDCDVGVRLVGIHSQEYSDGVVAACACSSLSSIPHELGEFELPDNWEIDHTSELFDDVDVDKTTSGSIL